MRRHRPASQKRISVFALTLLAIEFIDEFFGGVHEAAWPLIRGDLGLTYIHIGLLHTIPGVLGNIIEPFIDILSDVWRRRVLILGGGCVFVLAMILAAISPGFLVLLAAIILFYPASGSFVSLSQAVLMDMDVKRREQNMARWTFAGSLGVAAGPLALGAAVGLGAGWRGAFLAIAAAAAALLAAVWAQKFPRLPNGNGERKGEGGAPAFIAGFKAAFTALRRGEVVRWIVLLQLGDLMLDVLYGLLALYFVDVAGVSAEQAALGVAVWTVVGLAGDFLLIPLLEKVRGLSYLRISAALMGILFPAFLLVPSLVGKLIILGALGFLNSGWYAILQAQLYASMPGQSGAALAVANVGHMFGALIPLGLGLLAQAAGLNAAMWALMAGPAALFIGIPWTRKKSA